MLKSVRVLERQRFFSMLRLMLRTLHPHISSAMKKGDTCDLRSFQPLERHGTISLDLDMGRHIMDMAILIGKMMKMRLRTSGSKVFDVFLFFFGRSQHVHHFSEPSLCRLSRQLVEKNVCRREVQCLLHSDRRDPASKGVCKGYPE